MAIQKREWVDEKVLSNDNEMLFHDLSNYVHSLSFFLLTKIRHQEGLSYNECLEFEKELSLLKGLLGTKLSESTLENLGHRLNDLLVKMQSDIDCLFHSDHKYKIQLFIDPDLRKFGEYKISFNSYLRVFQNLIINMIENGDDQEGEVKVLSKNQGIQIETQNTISNKVKFKKGNGIGLKSIQAICLELGGYFNFSQKESIWISSCYLPFESNIQKEK